MLNQHLSSTLLLTSAILVGIIWATPGLGWEGKTTLMIFASTVILWTRSKLDANLIAILGALAMVLVGPSTVEQKPFLSALGDPFIVLLIAGFMIGEAWQSSGLSARIAQFFARNAQHVSGMFYWLTLALLLLSFIIPSTSARAAVMAPVYISIAAATHNRNIKRALALLFPSIIVLSCITSYLGAGANLITADLIQRFYHTKVSYSQWLLLGAPIGILSCFASTWIILRVFLNPEERKMIVPLQPTEALVETKQVQAQYATIITSALLILGWMTEQWHGLDPGVIGIAGALVLCLPVLNVLQFKSAIKKIEWSLVLFMAATIEMSNGLLHSGSINYIMSGVSNSIRSLPANGIILAIIAISLFSHLLINSRTARATVLLPLLLPIAVASGQSGLLIAFFANAAMGYCLTLNISAKPVALFSTLDEDSYSSKDLLRLSAYLIPIHFVLITACYYTYVALGWQ